MNSAYEKKVLAAGSPKLLPIFCEDFACNTADNLPILDLFTNSFFSLSDQPSICLLFSLSFLIFNEEPHEIPSNLRKSSNLSW